MQRYGQLPIAYVLVAAGQPLLDFFLGLIGKAHVGVSHQVEQDVGNFLILGLWFINMLDADRRTEATTTLRRVDQEQSPS